MEKGFLVPSAAAACTERGLFDPMLRVLYGAEGAALGRWRTRVLQTLARFEAIYGECPIRIFSVSGRTELGGNHTDHQHGCVLCGGISQDILCVAAKTDDNVIRVHSEGYDEIAISLDDTDVRASEYGTSASLIRGTAARFAALGKPVGGFSAYMISDVPKGSGMSSSAAFEVILGSICNDFYARDAFSRAELAMIAQYAENVYFGKPSGLMDQMACALGGVTAIDFAEPAVPKWEQIPLNLGKEGYALCIIDSGADHTDLTEEYTAITDEMRAVARELGGGVLRDITETHFYQAIPALRVKCGDRAVLRAMHFFGDNARVVTQAKALKDSRFDEYLALVNASGHSSELALQNIYAAGSKAQQAVAVALTLCRHLLCGKGACRVHGGGFAGTVQAYVPLGECERFRAGCDAVLGEGACHIMQIRSVGATALWDRGFENEC